MNSAPDPSALDDSAAEAVTFLKSLANKHRLMILCTLAEGESSVGLLAERLGISQPNASQHLLRLKTEGLIASRRDGPTIHYRLADRRVRPMIEVLYGLFCPKTA